MLNSKPISICLGSIWAKFRGQTPDFEPISTTYALFWAYFYGPSSISSQIRKASRHIRGWTRLIIIPHHILRRFSLQRLNLELKNVIRLEKKPYMSHMSLEFHNTILQIGYFSRRKLNAVHSVIIFRGDYNDWDLKTRLCERRVEDCLFNDRIVLIVRCSFLIHFHVPLFCAFRHRLVVENCVFERIWWNLAKFRNFWWKKREEREKTCR